MRHPSFFPSAKKNEVTRTERIQHPLTGRIENLPLSKILRKPATKKARRKTNKISFNPWCWRKKSDPSCCAPSAVLKDFSLLYFSYLPQISDILFPGPQDVFDFNPFLVWDHMLFWLLTMLLVKCGLEKEILAWTQKWK